MANPDYYLLVPVAVGGVSLRPGAPLYYSHGDPIATLLSGQPGVLWPGSDAYVTAAVNGPISKAIMNGADNNILAGLVLSAVCESLSNSKATVGAAIQELSLTIGYAALAAAGSVKTLDFTLSAAMPTGSRLLSLPVAESFTGFQNAGSTNTDGLTIGTAAGGAQIGASVETDVTGGSGFPKAFSAGGYAGMSLSGALVTARYTSSVNLNTLTAGSITVKLFYTVQP